MTFHIHIASWVLPALIGFVLGCACSVLAAGYILGRSASFNI